MSQDVALAEHLAGLKQVDQAAALLWLQDREISGSELTVAEIGKRLHDLGLAAAPNQSRLAEQLSRHPDVIRGQRSGTFKLRLASRGALDQKYESIIGKPRTSVSDSLLERAQFEGRRKVWQQLATQINGSYDHGFYDGAAVLARRLVESLIVAIFEARKLEAAIKVPNTNEYMLLEGLSGVLLSGKHIRLTRSGRDAVEPVRKLGNDAAHHPHHVTSKQEVDAIQHGLRSLVSELLDKLDGK